MIRKTLLIVMAAAVISIFLGYADSDVAGQSTDKAQIKISPANPTADDVISARISGTWPNGCIPQNPQITKLDGNKIRISTSTREGICTQALTPWNYVLDLSKLAAGTYQVSVVNKSTDKEVELGSQSFTVRSGAGR